MRRGNVKAVVERVRRSRAVRAAIRAHVPAVAADLETVLRADSAAAAESDDRRPQEIGATPGSPEEAPPEAASPEARARGPPGASPRRGTDRTTQKDRN
jgi:hypothetical protein